MTLFVGPFWPQGHNTVNEENFASLIFTNSVLRPICIDKNLQQGHDLPILVNGRAILPFFEDFIFT